MYSASVFERRISSTCTVEIFSSKYQIDSTNMGTMLTRLRLKTLNEASVPLLYCGVKADISRCKGQLDAAFKPTCCDIQPNLPRHLG